jgi:hypothetical protein
MSCELRPTNILRFPVYRFTLLVVSCPSVRTEKFHISDPYATSSSRIRDGRVDGVWWTIMPSLSGGRKIREPMIAWSCYYSTFPWRRVCTLLTVSTSSAYLGVSAGVYFAHLIRELDVLDVLT